MCETFDVVWQSVLVALLAFSIVTILLRLKYSRPAPRSKQIERPQWLAAMVFWGTGVVAFAMVVLMVLGFVCAGSPGDISGIVPN